MKRATLIPLSYCTALCLVCTLYPAQASPAYEKDLQRGQRQVLKKDYESAVASFTEVLRENPNVYEAYLSRADARVQIKDLEGALSDYDQAIKINPNVIESYIKRGDLNSQMGNQQAAIDDYTHALKLNPKEGTALFKRAAALKIKGDYAKAADDFNGVLKTQPQNIQAREECADCKVLACDYRGAIADYEYLLKKFNQKVLPLHYKIGEAFLLNGDKESARTHFEQVIAYYTKALNQRKKSGNDYIQRGLAYLKLEQHDKARADFESAVSLMPNDANAHYQLGHAKLVNGDTSDAIKELSEALQINPKLNAALLDKGYANLQLGDYVSAKKDLDVALASEKSTDGFITRGLARLPLGDVGGAISDLLDARGMNGKCLVPVEQKLVQRAADAESKKDNKLSLAQVLNQLGLVYLINNELDNAEKTTRWAIDIEEKQLSKNDPKIAFSMILLGKIYVKERSLLKAEALFRSAMTRLSNNPDGAQKYAIFALEDCARILIQSGNSEEAGAILTETRMARAVTGLSEQNFVGDLSRKAERAIEAYRERKKKFESEEAVANSSTPRRELPDEGAQSSSDQPDVAQQPVHEQQRVIDKPIRDKWAVIVGISHFKEPGHDLKYAAKDAKDFKDFLVKEKNFAPDHVQLLTDQAATRANILSLLGNKWLPRVAEPDDLVVIYFSGHGSPSSLDVGGVNYLIAYDTDIDDLYSTGIAMQDLSRIIKERVHCNRVMLLLDACHSGVAAPSSKGLARNANVNVDAIVQGTGQLVLSSSSPDQRSWESTRYEGSVFTRHLIQGLRKQGQLTKLGDAFGYLKDEVQREVLRDRGELQNPVMKSKWQGEDLIIGVEPANPSRGLSDIELPDPIQPLGTKPGAAATDAKRRGAPDKAKSPVKPGR